jgi:phage-related protein
MAYASICAAAIAVARRLLKDSLERSPIVEYLNALPVAEQAATQEAFSLLREFGLSLGMLHTKHISGKLWKLRPGANRFFYFAYVGRRFVILHAYRKQSQKTPLQELALAERRLAEVLTGGMEDGR